eukprot:gene50230-2788_t
MSPAHAHTEARRPAVQYRCGKDGGGGGGDGEAAGLRARLIANEAAAAADAWRT